MCIKCGKGTGNSSVAYLDLHYRSANGIKGEERVGRTDIVLIIKFAVKFYLICAIPLFC